MHPPTCYHRPQHAIVNVAIDASTISSSSSTVDSSNDPSPSTDSNPVSVSMLTNIEVIVAAEDTESGWRRLDTDKCSSALALERAVEMLNKTLVIAGAQTCSGEGDVDGRDDFFLLTTYVELARVRYLQVSHRVFALL